MFIFHSIICTFCKMSERNLKGSPIKYIISCKTIWLLIHVGTCNMYNCMFRYLTYTIHRYCFVMDLRDKLFRNNVVFIVLTWDCKAYLLSFQVNLLAPIVLWMSANGHGISVIHSNNERWNIYYFFQQVLHQFFPK